MNRATSSAAGRTVLALAAGAALVFGAGRTEAIIRVHQDAATPDATAATVTRTALFCPGAELGGVPNVPSVVTSAVLVGATAPIEALRGLTLPTGSGEVAVLPGRSSGLAADPDGAITTSNRERPVRVEIDVADPVEIIATGALAPGLSAAQESDSRSESVSGLMTMPCLAPSADAWLTGGSAEPGRQERLLLVNPGANAVTVDVAVHGRDGPLDTPGGAGIVVDSRSRSSVLLDGLATDEPTPVYHVTTRGGFVAASLSDYWLDGVTPRGTEDIAPLAAPAERVVIPGVAGGLPTAVRIAATGTGESVVQVRLLTPDGPRPLPGGRGVVRIPAGASTSVAVPGSIPKAGVAIEVTADQPVVAAASSTPERGPDFGWSASTAPITALAGASYPALPTDGDRRRTLALAGVDASATATVTTLGPGGRVETSELSVPADSTRTLDISDTLGVWVRRSAGTGALHAGVVTTAPEGPDFVLSGLPLVPVRLTTAQVPVVPARE